MDTSIYLFVGVMATILGFSLIVYALILYIAYRRKSKRYVGNIDVASVRDWEADLQLTAPMTSTTTAPTNTSSNPFDMLTSAASTPVVTPAAPVVPVTPVVPTPPPSVQVPATAPMAAMPSMNHQQILVALEQLVKQHHMGLIDESQYQQRKAELFGQLSGVSGSAITQPHQAVSDEPKSYTSYEELVIDFTEGIITAKEFEQHKAQFNQ